MTKAVRIENADMNMSVEVVVITEDRVYDSENHVMTDQWREVNREVLKFPTQLSTVGITDTRRLRIEEQRKQ